jgi:ectoine hydroxylase-related dioxygenase (phytanoyl-CoA dioxygenase family)
MFSDVKKKILKYLVAFKYTEKLEIQAQKELSESPHLTQTKKEELQEQLLEVKEEIILKKEFEEALKTNIKELQENGYTIIHNVYNNEEIEEYKREFFNWYKNTKDVEELHPLIHGNGIFKYFEIGHQRFNWLARTNPKVVNIFKQLWNTDELVTSFDGCCYYPSEYKGDDVYWTHTDQSSYKKGCHCYQSFLSLTNNSERTLLVYKGSHLLHEHYFKTLNIDAPRDWCILDKNYVNNLENKKVYVKVNAGDLVVWDSRTFHQNSCGNLNCNEERLVQYLCYLPKNHIKNDIKQRALRREYFEERYTTSHWPYPLTIVPLQPYYNYYSESKIIIDYDKLPKPKLEDLKEEIYKLL